MIFHCGGSCPWLKFSVQAIVRFFGTVIENVELQVISLLVGFLFQPAATLQSTAQHIINCFVWPLLRKHAHTIAGHVGTLELPLIF